jgi:DNA-binding transcriptional LysR family regulator
VDEALSPFSTGSCRTWCVVYHAIRKGMFSTMNLRHLRYFAALARERHHGRAAEACHVTQPTLSGAIRQLETEVGTPLIRREGVRMTGLTEAGERVLAFAQRMMTEQDTLSQQLSALRDELSGELRIGSIPAAIGIVPVLTTVFHARHAGVAIRVLSKTSVEISQGLAAGDLEAGLTYLDNEPLSGVEAIPLYVEHLVLLTPARGSFADAQTARWQDAAALPLCLLTPDMQNRRIIDAVFERSGVGRPNIAIEANSILALLAHVRHGSWSTIVPQRFVSMLGDEHGRVPGMKALPLVEPEAGQRVGLVVADRSPYSPVVEALVTTIRKLGPFKELASDLPGSASP